MRLPFTKMQGLGNDFVVLDGVSQPLELSGAQYRWLADRHFGVGCDQILLVEPPQDTANDFRYRIFNADGGEVEQCGNGARCFARFVVERGLTAKRAIRVETRKGLIVPELTDAGLVTVDMGVPRFAPAGQTTQMIIGATGESDYTLLQTSQALYQGFDLKRVFYSAYIPLNDDSILPQIGTPPPLLREHRLYQADWLLRFYGFQADELLSESQPNFNELLDPKCDWALRHLEHFPVEVEKASYATLLRVPGIGPKSASRITYARQYGRLNFDNLKRMGVVLKRAHYFITCGGRQMYRTPIEEAYITRQLVQVDAKDSWKVQHSNESYSQMTLADFGIG